MSEELSRRLAVRRHKEIQVVSSAFASIVAQLAYLTMPVTTGPRLYDVLAKYGVSSKEELEKKRPGALWEEVMVPNLDEGRALAEAIYRARSQAIVVPGLFDASAFKWRQEDYMTLWLRLIASGAKELFLAPGWQYSTGGVQEFVRGMMLQFRFAVRPDPLKVWNERQEPMSFSEGAMKVAYAIRHLGERGFDNSELLREFRHLANIAGTLMYLSERYPMLWEHHVSEAPSFSCWDVLSATSSLGIRPQLIYTP